jgi:hypothetical protein
MQAVQYDSSVGIPQVAQSGWSTNCNPIYAIQMYSSFRTSYLQVAHLNFILLDKSEVADALSNRNPNSQQKSVGFRSAFFLCTRTRRVHISVILTSAWLLFGSWLFCKQHLPCSVSFQCILGGCVEVWTKSIVCRFIEGQTHCGMSRGPKMSLALNEPK